MEGDMATGQKYSVPSVDRALAILELLAESQRGYSLSEISRKLGLPKSSIHLLITTLEGKGYLHKNESTGKYRFGLKLITLSRRAIDNLSLREEARPFLKALMLKTSLTVHMAVLEQGDAVIVEKVEAPGMLRLATSVGGRLGINSSAVGKALLAFLPEQEIARQVEGKRLAKHNDNTIAAPSRMRRELEKIKALGYAFEDEEGEIGFRCLGAPIFDHSNNVVAALSVAGTTSQIPHERADHLGRTVRAVANEISTHLWSAKHEGEPATIPSTMNDPYQETRLAIVKAREA
jgi:IclR family transcriptional regulator, KDG regulon repressor